MSSMNGSGLLQPMIFLYVPILATPFSCSALNASPARCCALLAAQDQVSDIRDFQHVRDRKLYAEVFREHAADHRIAVKAELFVITGERRYGHGRATIIL